MAFLFPLRHLFDQWQNYFLLLRLEMLFKWRESAEEFVVLMLQFVSLLVQLRYLAFFLLLVDFKLFLQVLKLFNDGLRIDSFFHDIDVPLD